MTTNDFVAKFSMDVIEKSDEFIFQTILPFCEERSQTIISKPFLEKAILNATEKDPLEITTSDNPLRVWVCPNCLKTEYIIEGGNYCGFCGQKIKPRREGEYND